MVDSLLRLVVERLCIRIVYGVWIERIDVNDWECANSIGLVQWSNSLASIRSIYRVYSFWCCGQVQGILLF